MVSPLTDHATLVTRPLTLRTDLLPVSSAKMENVPLLMVPDAKRRGISHGDMIDLNRENIPGFDVREWYVQLVQQLKQKGF